MARKKLAVLISGRGSNLQSLIDAAQGPDYPAEIALVISNRADAAGLERAARAGVPAKVIDHRAFGKGDVGRSGFETALAAALDESAADYVCLAGFMRLLTAEFVNRFEERILNIHPSLLPAFRGLNVHEAMIAAGVKIAGCTVHLVTAGMDEGPIIGQAAVPVVAGDTPQSLAERILAEEHRLYPACVRLVCEGRIRLADGKATLVSASATPSALHNPQS